MNRRRAITYLLALGGMLVPLRGNSQVTTPAKPVRIATVPDFAPVPRSWFSDAMRDLGWQEGRDFFVLESRYHLGERGLDEAAKLVVGEKPDVILTQATASALHRATATIPIVMLYSGYPVEAGLANSLARPGKNVTGNTVYAGVEVWGKLLQLLRNAKPQVSRVAVLWTYGPPEFPREELEPMLTELTNAGRSLGLNLHITRAAHADQVAAALAQIDAERPDALLLTSSFATNLPLASSIMHFAVKRRLPTIADAFWPAPINPYPLLIYGPDVRELFRSAAASVDKILKGAKPGDLPIQQPARFEMILNLKTASAIGLAIPQDLALRADRVIE